MGTWQWRAQHMGEGAYTPPPFLIFSNEGRSKREGGKKIDYSASAPINFVHASGSC